MNRSILEQAIGKVGRPVLLVEYFEDLAEPVIPISSTVSMLMKRHGLTAAQARHFTGRAKNLIAESGAACLALIQRDEDLPYQTRAKAQALYSKHKLRRW